MKKRIYLIVTLVIVLSLIGLLFITKSSRYSVVDLNGKDFSQLPSDGAAIVYTSSLNDDVKTFMNNIYDDYKVQGYVKELKVEEINKLLDVDNITNNDQIIIFMNREAMIAIDANQEATIIEYLEKYLFNKIPTAERKFKVLSTAEEYIKKVYSKNYTIAVFGSSTCTYCDLYLPVINEVADKYKLDIYYFDKDEYDFDEYQDIMNLDFEIPAKCTTTGFPTTMTKSFPKPMTLITKSGKLVDCVKGYVVEDELVDVLKEYKIVKE